METYLPDSFMHMKKSCDFASTDHVLFIYIYIYTYSLTGHFIRYTLLVPGWTPFSFRTLFFVAYIQQGVGNIPQRCWSILS